MSSHVDLPAAGMALRRASPSDEAGLPSHDDSPVLFENMELFAMRSILRQGRLHGAENFSQPHRQATDSLFLFRPVRSTKHPDEKGIKTLAQCVVHVAGPGSSTASRPLDRVPASICASPILGPRGSNPPWCAIAI